MTLPEIRRAKVDLFGNEFAGWTLLTTGKVAGLIRRREPQGYNGLCQTILEIFGTNPSAVNLDFGRPLMRVLVIVRHHYNESLFVEFRRHGIVSGWMKWPS